MNTHVISGGTGELIHSVEGQVNTYIQWRDRCTHIHSVEGQVNTYIQ